MKNIVNYLDEFIEDDLDECCARRIKKDSNKDIMKANKKSFREEEIKESEKPFRNKNRKRYKNK